jgi:hypothetical protein
MLDGTDLAQLGSFVDEPAMDAGSMFRLAIVFLL